MLRLKHGLGLIKNDWYMCLAFFGDGARDGIRCMYTLAYCEIRGRLLLRAHYLSCEHVMSIHCHCLQRSLYCSLSFGVPNLPNHITHDSQSANQTTDHECNAYYLFTPILCPTRIWVLVFPHSASSNSRLRRRARRMRQSLSVPILSRETSIQSFNI